MTDRIIPKMQLNFRAPEAADAGVIAFAIGRCIEGALLVARSRRGICAIFLDDDAEALRQQLVDAFPDNAIEEAPVQMQRDLAQVTAFIDKSAASGIIDLDIGGTPFQQRVWEALCGIPAGETRTYAEVAQCIGAPEAIRAVASACAANMLAIAVPCHRVVRSDGELSGYRWGAARKNAILVREREMAVREVA